MHRRQYTKGLDTKQVDELTKGWQHAARIGHPLNVFVTIRPFEEYDPAKMCKVAAGIRNKLGVYARQHGFAFVAAWTRECNPDGSGEHFHLLMHVPPRHFADLVEKVIGWHPEPGAADIRRAHQTVLLSGNGNRMSAIGYIAKQMTPQAWWRRGLNRKAGGAILGKRGGVTRNIGPVVIEEYFSDLRRARRQSDQPSRTPGPALPAHQGAFSQAGSAEQVRGYQDHDALESDMMGGQRRPRRPSATEHRRRI
jgi:hypothetical protein